MINKLTATIIAISIMAAPIVPSGPIYAYKDTLRPTAFRNSPAGAENGGLPKASGAGLELVEGVEAVNEKPVGKKQVRLFGEATGYLVYSYDAEYNGGSYRAKMANSMSILDEYDAIVQPAKILIDLNAEGVKGIPKIAYLLELTDRRKVVLFKRFEDEYGPGKDLIERINDPLENMTHARIVEITIAVSEIVKSLLDNGVYHWDIKPQNIWISDKGDIILFDYDFAFRIGPLEEFTLKEAYNFATKFYASKHRRSMGDDKSEDDISYSPADEIYSLGVTLACMLVGSASFDRYESSTNCLRYHDLLRDLEQQVPEPLLGVLSKAVEGNTSKYDNIDDFIADLEKCREAVSEQQPDPGTEGAKPASAGNVPYFANFNEMFYVVGELGHSDFSRTLLCMYNGPDKDLPNGEVLRNASLYVVKKVNEAEDSEAFIVGQARELIALNPRNDNPHLPKLIGLARISSEKDAIVLERIAGVGLQEFIDVDIIKAGIGPIERSHRFIGLILSILKTYRNLFIRTYRVHGDIGEDLFRVRKGSGDIAWVDNETISRIDDSSESAARRKIIGKISQVTADRFDRIDLSDDSSQYCLPRDDLYALCRVLLHFTNRWISYESIEWERKLIGDVEKTLERYGEIANDITDITIVQQHVTFGNLIRRIEALEARIPGAGKTASAGAGRVSAVRGQLVINSAIEAAA
ncbi:MAG: protein kinase family protein [Candidatus Omnitrophica bacterium]|nr:protein kinase family protein [Candidatus Omnitrophota bacterium]